MFAGWFLIFFLWFLVRSIAYQKKLTDFIGFNLLFFSIFLIFSTFLYLLKIKIELIVLFFKLLIFLDFIFVIKKLVANKKKLNFKINLNQWLVDLPFLVFPLILFSLSDRYLVSYHGAYHYLISLEILKNIQPLFNPLLPFLPLNNYWGYHLVLAVLTKTFASVSVYHFNGLINLFSLIGCLIIIKKHAQPKTLSILPFLITYLGYVVSVNFFDRSVDGRLFALYHKFLNFNAFPLAVFLTTYLVLEKKYSFFILPAILIIHPVTAFFALVFFLLDNFNSGIGQFIEKKLPSFILTLVLLLIVYLFYLRPLTQGYQKIINFDLFWFKQNFYLILFLGFVFAFLAEFFNIKKRAEIIVVGIFFLVSPFLNLPDYNQYKLFLLTSYFLTICFLKNSKKIGQDFFVNTVSSVFIVITFVVTVNFYLNMYFKDQTLTIKNNQINAGKMIDPLVKKALEQKKDKQTLILIRQPVDKNSLFLENSLELFPFVSFDNLFTQGWEKELEKRKKIYQELVKKYCGKKTKSRVKVFKINNNLLLCPTKKTVFVKDSL